MATSGDNSLLCMKPTSAAPPSLTFASHTGKMLRSHTDLGKGRVHWEVGWCVGITFAQQQWIASTDPKTAMVRTLVCKDLHCCQVVSRMDRPSMEAHSSSLRQLGIHLVAIAPGVKLPPRAFSAAPRPALTELRDTVVSVAAEAPWRVSASCRRTSGRVGRPSPSERAHFLFLNQCHPAHTMHCHGDKRPCWLVGVWSPLFMNQA